MLSWRISKHPLRLPYPSTPLNTNPKPPQILFRKWRRKLGCGTYCCSSLGAAQAEPCRCTQSQRRIVYIQPKQISTIQQYRFLVLFWLISSGSVSQLTFWRRYDVVTYMSDGSLLSSGVCPSTPPPILPNHIANSNLKPLHKSAMICSLIPPCSTFWHHQLPRLHRASILRKDSCICQPPHDTRRRQRGEEGDTC